MSDLYTRWQGEPIKGALQTRRVVYIAGARQCGKTTLAKQIAGKSSVYRTLDDLSVRQFAIEDPQGFVKFAGNMLIIDEVQRAPDLLSAIKLVVDENTKPGQFLLTGSANIQSLPGVQESLAGRIRKMRLRPLSQGEIFGSQPVFLDNAFNLSFKQDNYPASDRKSILNYAFRGGFPEAVLLNNKDRQQWHRDYMDALIERDLKDITHINRIAAMHDLVNTLAAWSGKFMDISAIGSGLSITRPTIQAYMSALEALFIVETVQPWTRTDYDRVGKQSKLFMTDSGLLASLLRWHFDQVEFDADRSGKLIETFVFNELMAQIDCHVGKYQLFHYRDREKREIDFIVERDDQALLGIEIKAGSAISRADFSHLKWFKENIAKQRPFIGIVLYTGDQIGKMGDNLWAIPFGALW